MTHLCQRSRSGVCPSWWCWIRSRRRVCRGELEVLPPQPVRPLASRDPECDWPMGATSRASPKRGCRWADPAHRLHVGVRCGGPKPARSRAPYLQLLRTRGRASTGQPAQCPPDGPRPALAFCRASRRTGWLSSPPRVTPLHDPRGCLDRRPGTFAMGPCRTEPARAQPPAVLRGFRGESEAQRESRAGTSRALMSPLNSPAAHEASCADGRPRSGVGAGVSPGPRRSGWLLSRFVSRFTTFTGRCYGLLVCPDLRR